MTSINKILSAYNYLSIYLLILSLFNFLLISLPLTGDFGYEFSALNSLLIVFLSGAYTIYLFKGNPTKDKLTNSKILKYIKNSYLLFLFIPFFIGIVNALINASCPVEQGIYFYLIIVLPSVIIGGTLALIPLVIIDKYSKTIFILLYILILAIPLFEFYFNPQVYFFNPLFTYFPGTIYDEAISINFDIILYRFFNVIFFVPLFIFLIGTKFNIFKISKKLLTTFLILIPLIFYYFSSEFGFNTSINRIKKELRGEITTEHFTINYPLSIDKNLIKAIALHHEYYFIKLEDFFNVIPEEKIKSFIFTDSEQKKKFIGSENADIAKPWLYQIYTVFDNYDVTLKHEIAHIFAGAFGWGAFKVANWFNPALIEGAASAADPFYDENYIDFMAALAYKNQYKVDIENLFNSLSFFGSTSSISYIYAGSFCKFLIDNFGIEKFKQYYATNEFTNTYSVSFDNLLKNYFSFLENYSGTENKAMADYYFGRPSIFMKVCPRYVATRLKEGWEHFSNNEFRTSEKIFYEILKVTDSYSALVGASESLAEQDSLVKAQNIILENLEKYKNTSYYYNLEFRLADMFSRSTDYNIADTIYNSIENIYPNRRLFYLSKIRHAIIKKDTLINIYLEGNNFDKYYILKELNIPNYNYFSFPVIIELSRTVEEAYKLFLRQFKKTIFVKDFTSSYATLSLSKYMMENLDYSKARKMAALSLRFDADKNFNHLIRSNFNKMNWFFFNAENNLSKMKFNILERN